MEDFQKNTLDNFKRYVVLSKRKEELNSELKQIKDEMDALDVILAEHMIENGLQNMRIDDRLVYLQTSPFAKFLETESANRIARKHGLGYALKRTIHPQTARGIVNEFTDEQGNRPDWIAKVFDIYEKTDVRVRK